MYSSGHIKFMSHIRPHSCVSGKTWSMQGGATEEAQGIIPRMAKHLFDRINAEKADRPTMLFMVTASYFELYNEVIFVSRL